jgi:hypothetical protein
MTLSKKLGAEFIGTFWLVLGGCGSAVLAASFPDVGIGLLGVSLAFRTYCVNNGLCYWSYFWVPSQSCCFDRALVRRQVFSI